MRFGVLVLLVATMGCAMTREKPGDVAYLGARRPAKPDDCQVAVFLTERPPYPTTDVASSRVTCEQRQACLDRLRVDACRAGADVLYGFSEGTTYGSTSMSAVLAAANTASRP
jgi:hypothetical protein